MDESKVFVYLWVMCYFVVCGLALRRGMDDKRGMVKMEPLD